MSTQVEEDISGTVEILHYAKSGFSAGKLYSGGRRISFSVKGLVRQGYPVTIRGQWETHPKYGKQFKGSQVVQTMPADAEGIRSWLEVYATGMGPAKSRQAVEVFGIDLPRLMADSPEQVAIELKLPLEFVNRTAKLWSECSSQTNTLATLLGLGLTQLEAESLYEKYQGAAVAVLDDDPYSILGEVPGFGWARVDSLGERIGIAPADPRRTVAAVIEVVRKSYKEGSTAVPATLVHESAAEFIGGGVEPGVVENAAARAVEAKRLVCFSGLGYSLPAAAAIERRLWKDLASFAKPNPYFKPSNVSDEEIGEFRHKGRDVKLDPKQIEAVRLTLTNRGSVITGGAGTGKTTIATAIYRQYQASDLPIAVCAPTGKAGRRIGDEIGCEASTIHRLLGYSPGAAAGREFEHDENNCLPHKLVIVDEVSMCDSSLLASLLRAISPDACVVLIGDPNQLPPVGPGFPLRDLLNNNLCPIARLTTCHRQAGPLASSSAEVLQGSMSPTDVSQVPPGWVVNDRMASAGESLAAIKFLFAGAPAKPPKLREWGFGDLFSHQFMSAKHAGMLGTQVVNELLQRLHQATLGVTLSPRNPAEERLPILVGDKVIQTRNNYELGVMNGTLGRVVGDQPLIVEFEDSSSETGWKEITVPQDCRGDVSLAYCLTPHKMQGSQVPCAIVIVPKEHSFMQHRNWLYTAVTRARRTAVVFGDSLGFKRAAERIEIDTRRTVLDLFAAHPETQP